MNNDRNDILSNLLIYILVLFASCDIFRFYFTKYMKGISFYLLLFVIFIMSILRSKNLKTDFLHKKYLIFSIMWVIIFIINNQFLANYIYSIVIFGINFNIFTLQALQVLCIFVVFYYLDSSNENKVKVNIIKIMLFSIIINMFVTLRALDINPNITKIMATQNVEGYIDNFKGASGYSLIYSIVIIMPLFYYGVKEYKNVLKLLQILFIGLLIYFVYKAAYTIAFISLICGTFIYLYLNLSNKLKVMLTPMLLMLVYSVINQNSISYLLIDLSEKIKITQISTRFYQIAIKLLYGDDSGDTLYRLVLYKNSISAFIKYPFTGITILEPDYKLSGHSTFLDILGGMGLIGFIPYIMFLLYSYKISINKAGNKSLRNAIRISYIIFLLVASINTLTTSLTINMFLLFFINWYPIMIKTTQKRFKKEN